MSKYFRLFQSLFNGIPELKGIDFAANYYKSKKNLVYEIKFNKKPLDYPKTLVLKKFPLNSEKMGREIKTLQILEQQKLNIPHLLYYDQEDYFLILEKVEGLNVCDYINNSLMGYSQLGELDNSVEKKIISAVDLIAEWLAHLHKNNIIDDNGREMMVLNKGDTRLRDFILDISNNKLYGVDFEESYVGHHLDDLAWICCSLLDTNPGIFEMDVPTHKISLVNQFLNKYYKINQNFSFSFEYFADILINNLNQVIERRHLDIGVLDKGSILKKIIDNI